MIELMPLSLMTLQMRQISRAISGAYMDYAVVGAENMFELNRPTVSPDGKSATVEDKAWDGVYR